MKNALKFIALALVLTLSQSAVQAQDEARKAPPKQWILETLDGENIDLNKRIQEPGNRIMVFWATWCPFCKQLMPIVSELKRDYPDLEVLSFNVFDDITREDYATKADWPFIHVLGGDEFARVHGVKGLPTLFLINGEGKMVLDLREIDTKGTEEDASNRVKAAHYAPLWNKGLREALDKLNWE